MSRLGRVAALGALAVVLLPLAGILVAVVDPPAGPLGDAAPSLFDVITPELALTTLALGVLVGGLAVVLGTWLAWVEARGTYPGRSVLGVLGLLPLAVPSYVLASTLATTLGPGGFVGRPLGLPVFSGFATAVLVLVLSTTPYVQLVVGAALGRMSAGEEEAARTLGASSARIFRVVVLPRIQPAVVLSGLIALLYAISDFGAVAVLDVPVLTWRLYGAVRSFELGRAAWMGLALLVLLLPVFGITSWLRRDGTTRTVANPRPPTRRPLSRGALLATYALHVTVIGLGVMLPVVTLASWVAHGIETGATFAPLWTPVRDTVTVALAAAAFTVLTAAPLASQPSRLREQLVYLTSALPGVLLAFGLLLLTLAIARATGGGRDAYGAVLGSGVLLFVGYVTRFLAEVYGPLRTAYEQLDPRQRESARVLGASTSTWFRRVAAPALAPGAAAAYAIGFLAVIKELPITLMLGGPAGARTLAFRMWDRYSESLWHDAGAAGLILVGLALAMLSLTLRWRTRV